MAVIDSYATSNYSGSIFNLSTDASHRKGCGQEMTVALPHRLDSVQFYLQKNGAPTGNIIARAYGMTSALGVDSGRGVLASSDPIAATSVGGTMALFTFNFSAPNNIILMQGTYTILAEFVGGDINNFISVGLDGTTPTHPGRTRLVNSAGTFSLSSTADTIFTLSGTPNPVMPPLLPFFL